MNQLATFVRSSGQGENLICLHSCLGSSRQWLALADQLQMSFQTSAPDLYGSGKAPEWRFDQPLTLRDEVKMIAPLIDAMNGPVHLVGHSYGAAVALKVAQMYAHKVSSVIVYEPVLFTLLFAGRQLQPAASEIFRVIEAIQQHYESGKPEKAVQQFIDYWSGAGSWERFSAEQQAAMSSKVAMVIANFEALMAEYVAEELLQSLEMPVYCLYGERSPITTRQIADIMGRTCSDIVVQGLPGMGHMGPVTHSDVVNHRIEAILTNQYLPTSKGAFQQAA